MAVSGCLSELVFASYAVSFCFMAVAGPYRVVVDHLEACPPHMEPKTKYYRLLYHAVRDRKKQDVWFFTGNVTTFITANNNYTGTVNLASWSSRGGWKDNAFSKVVPRVCAALKMILPDMWRKAMEYAFNDPERECPFPPGTYTVTNVSTNFQPKFPPSFFYGKWRGTALLNNTVTKELVMCLRAYYSLVPK